MAKHSIRVYADTSVYGGVFDEEFTEASQSFFDLVHQGEYTLCVSKGYRQIAIHSPLEVINYEELTI